MAIRTYAVLEGVKVINVVLWDMEASPDWTPPKGTQLIEVTEMSVGPGHEWDGTKFIDPSPAMVLADAKASATAALQAVFAGYSGSITVDAQLREKLRQDALTALNNVGAATSVDDVSAALAAGIAAMKAQM